MYALRFKLLLAAALAIAPASSAFCSPGDDQFAVAAGHYSAKRWQLATEEFERFLAEFPDHENRPKAQFYYAESLVQCGRYADAYGRFVEVLAEGPRSAYAKQALFRAAETAFMSGRTDEARMRMSQFQALHPDDKLNAHLLLYQAEMQLGSQNATEAAQLYQQLIERFGDQPVADEARLAMVDLKKARGQNDAAGELLHKVAEGTSSPWAEIAILQLAAQKVDAGEHAASIELYDSIQQRFPESPLTAHAQLGQGRALYHLQQFSQARPLLESVVSHPELGSDARYWLAMVDKGEQKWKDAADQLSAALESEQAEAQQRVADQNGNGAAESSSKQVPQQSTQSTSPGTSEGLAVKIKTLDTPNAEHAPEVSEEKSAIDSNADGQQPAHRSAIANAERQSRRADAIRYHAAEAMIRAGDFDRAIETLEAEPTHDDDNVQAFANRYLLAVALQGQKRNDEALTTLRALLQNIDRQLSRHDRASAGEGRLTNADVNLLKSLRASARLAMARLLITQEKFDEALVPLEGNWASAESGANGQTDLKLTATDLAICLAKTGQYARALQVIDELGAQQPADALVYTTIHHVAEAAYAAGDYGTAAALFERLTNPNAPRQLTAAGRAGIAWSQYQAGQFDLAIESFSQFLDQFASDPRAPDAALAKAAALERLERNDAALTVYAQAAIRYPHAKQLPQILLADARLHDRLGQDDAAILRYQRIVREFPESDELDAALYGWAWALRDLGKEDASDELFERLHREHRQSAYWSDATYRLAERAAQRGDRRAALDLLELLAACDNPPLVAQHALYLQAQLEIGQQQWHDAEVPLRRMLELYPESPLRLPAEFWFAEIAYRRGDFDEAASRFEVVAEQAGASNDRWLGMIPLRQSQLAMQKRRWDRARELAQSVARDFPDFDQQYEADYVIGRCLAADADFDGARAAYRKVIRSEAGRRSETAAMAQWMIAESYFHQENYSTALREYLRVEILYPFPRWQAAALLQAGKCHERLGQLKEAADLYSHLIEKHERTEITLEAAARLDDVKKR